MKTVHDYTYALLRHNKIDMIFGNPGSNELPFLKNFPPDFRYILALHEGAALSMADGYAQASGRTTFVNLHSAAGTGNAMGALTNSCNSRTPIVITSGQQTRHMMGVEALLTNVSATQLPMPLVKWSYEPASAAEVPHAISRAIHFASAEPAGPVYLSIPYHDWDVQVDEQNQHLLDRAVNTRACLSEVDLEWVCTQIQQAERIALVLGADVDRQQAVAEAVRFAEQLNVPVWGAPSPSRCPFPNRHAFFQGFLTASIAAISSTFAAYDLVLVFGAPVFRYHQYDPGPYLRTGTRLISFHSDAYEAARAPMGRSFVTDLKDCLHRLSQHVEAKLYPVPKAKAVIAAAESRDGVIQPERLFDLIDHLAPAHVVYTNEATSTNSILWERLSLNGQGSYYFAAAGGLGFGLPAAIGIQLALPHKRVVAIIGDGSANYTISALWTAAQYQIPVIFIILKNGSYGALQWFAGVLQADDIPGIEIPDIDFVQLAQGYGVHAYHPQSDAAFIEIFNHALDSNTPTLIEVNTQPET